MKIFCFEEYVFIRTDNWSNETKKEMVEENILVYHILSFFYWLLFMVFTKKYWYLFTFHL